MIGIAVRRSVFFVDDNVIKAAQETFDFIQNTASNGLRQRDTKI